MKSNGKLAVYVVFGVLILSVLSSVVFCGNKEKEQPKFYVRKTTVELGDFYEGEDIHYTFTVRNNGLGELHITNVKPG
jgi:hypothetical protein